MIDGKSGVQSAKIPGTSKRSETGMQTGLLEVYTTESTNLNEYKGDRHGRNY